MHFHIAHTKKTFEDNFVSHSGGPNEQFGTHEKMSGDGGGVVGCKVTIWMPGHLFGYVICT